MADFSAPLPQAAGGSGGELKSAGAALRALITREFWASAYASLQSERVARLKALAKAGKIDLVVPYQLQALEGKDGQLSIVVAATLDGTPKRIEADMLLPFFGLSMSLGPIADWGVALERNQIAVEPSTAATSKPGIFAIGDVVTYPGKLKLILTGFSEAAIAARSAYALVHPEKPLHFEYSTTAGVPDA